MLEIGGLQAGYGHGQVLQGVSLRVEPGECVALLGRNGVGRSTLLKAIMGMLGAGNCRGRIAFNGERIDGLATFEIARRGIGYVPEGRDVFPHLSVAQNLALGRPPVRPTGGRTTLAFDPYALFPALATCRDTPAGVLSGGEQQMLAIARALAARPSLLLVDEPTEGLAPGVVQALARVLDGLRRDGIALLLVEQKMTIALDLAQRVIVMGRGRVVFEGTPRQLQAAEAVRTQWLGIGLPEHDAAERTVQSG
jgi:branched-chain amino acid transport system ATP-binding protein